MGFDSVSCAKARRIAVMIAYIRIYTFLTIPVILVYALLDLFGPWRYVSGDQLFGFIPWDTKLVFVFGMVMGTLITGSVFKLAPLFRSVGNSIRAELRKRI